MSFIDGDLIFWTNLSEELLRLSSDRIVLKDRGEDDQKDKAEILNLSAAQNLDDLPVTLNNLVEMEVWDRSLILLYFTMKDICSLIIFKLKRFSSKFDALRDYDDEKYEEEEEEEDDDDNEQM
ncbi:hypothetical protein BY996DRAFT_6542586 [Phakopsora pachyrhizi]|nr:hypothetical protein BY996DRAFT_6542586 [Phakopsora pachyrhizi]